jgi:hypothetical protein
VNRDPELVAVLGEAAGGVDFDLLKTQLRDLSDAAG